MISLIKIRATYLKRNKAKIFLSYCLIPIIVIIGVFVYISKKDPEGDLEFNPKQNFNYDYGSDFYLFRDSKNNISELKPYLSNTSLVVNNRIVGNKLVEYIEDEIKVKLNLYTDENQLNNHSQNVIILDYDEDKKSYKFSYREKEIIGGKSNNSYPFKTEQLSSQNASDVFKYEYNKKYSLTDTHNKRFLLYQAFLARFLVEEIYDLDIKRDIHFNFGLNSYPPSVKNPRNYDIIEVMLSYLL